MKIRLTLLFGIAFILNLVWEKTQSGLYLNFAGGPITDEILFGAAVFDALFITLLSAPFLRSAFLAKRLWIFVSAAIACATFIEIHALSAKLWVYAPAMPIIPFLGTGIAPTIQLGLLGYISFKASSRFVA